MSVSSLRASLEVLPGGVNSPVRSFFHVASPPLVFTRGEGSLLWDEEGRPYIDYCMGFGSLILGHAHPRVVAAIQRQAAHGSLFGLSNPLEATFAARIIAHYPSIDKMRFVNSGTEATMSALRLARAATGRPLIVKCDGHYHGHSDALLVRPGSSAAAVHGLASRGVPREAALHTLSLPFNEVEEVRALLRRHASELAAVIVEPVACNMGLIPAHPAFLEMLREETQRSSALLILDEVISGLRFGLGGAQQLFGIAPDLTCLGKIVGGGLPAAAFGGARSLMDLLAPLGDVYQAGTFSGNPLSMRAGLTTLELLEGDGFYAALDAKADRLLCPIEAFIRERELPVHLARCGSAFSFFFGVRRVSSWSDLAQMERATFTAFFHFLRERGILLPPSPYETSFLSAAHTEEDLERTRAAILDFLATHYT